MTKEQLIAMGLTAEQADKVLAQQTEEMKGFVPRTRLDEEAGKVTNLNTQLADRDKDIKTLKEAAGKGTDLEKQLADLQGKYKTDTESFQKQLADQQLDSALNSAIFKAKARDPISVKAHLDKAKLKLKDDGSIEGLDLVPLQKEKPYLFDVETRHDEGTGFSGGKPPTGGAQGKTVSQQDFQTHINDVRWMQANMEAVTAGLANGSLKKG